MWVSLRIGEDIESMNISCILEATEMYDTILKSVKEKEIFYMEFWTIWSKMYHLVQIGPWRKNNKIKKLIAEMGYMCPRKVDTKIFSTFVLVILVLKVKYTKTSQWILMIFHMGSLYVPLMIIFEYNEFLSTIFLVSS